MMDTTTPAEVLCTTRYMRLMRRDHWFYADRVNICGVVGIVAITPEEKLLLVEQYRYPVDRRVIELPAGLAGDTAETRHESLAEAARRELREETGYAAARMRFLTAGPSSAGTTTEMIDLYLAEELTRVGPGGGDGTEDLTIHEIPLPQVPQWLEARRREGVMIDLRIYTALFFLEHRALIA